MMHCVQRVFVYQDLPVRGPGIASEADRGCRREKKIRYLISVPGCYYEIEYGLMKRSGRGG
jgi:hypothetical protein